jgi:hypothetical protein
MHRSSESVAAIATALAKAQTELTNPEKGMVGIVYISDRPQSFRYASLSSGLEIIRKTLGGQQIAIAQTTDIDRANGMVNLTTVLLHTSGEWISSDWPVCPISETSAPRRMGAALTYARRYALFTMVGIAGEDDLDAPDLANDQPTGGQAADARVSVGRGAEPAPIGSGQYRTGNSITPPVREKRGVEESTALAAQLIREIETLSKNDLQPRAISILKAKNRLSADDAKRVEQAFEARMGRPTTLPEADETTSVAIDVAPPEPRRRGRPRKTKAPNEAAEARQIPLVITDNPVLPSPRHQAGDTPAKIGKGELIISEPRRHRDKTHLKFVASQPCLVCGRTPADAHHLRFTQPRAMGRKVSDEFTVPLCRTHHRDNHRFGDEQAWWAKQATDPVETSRQLWILTRGIL